MVGGSRRPARRSPARKRGPEQGQRGKGDGGERERGGGKAACGVVTQGGGRGNWEEGDGGECGVEGGGEGGKGGAG